MPCWSLMCKTKGNRHYRLAANCDIKQKKKEFRGQKKKRKIQEEKNLEDRRRKVQEKMNLKDRRKEKYRKKLI